MFDEEFFQGLDRAVARYVEASDEIDQATVLVRTRLGTFNVARVHAGEALVRLRVYPPPQDQAADEGSAAGDTRPAEKQRPATDLHTLPLAFVPYAEVLMVEVMPLVGDRGFLPLDDALPDPVIGFGR